MQREMAEFRNDFLCCSVMQMGNLVRYQKQGLCKKRVSCTSAKNIAGVTPGPDTAQGPSMKSKNETDKRQAKGDKNIHYNKHLLQDYKFLMVSVIGVAV